MMIMRFKIVIVCCVVLVIVNVLMLAYLEQHPRRRYGLADVSGGGEPRQTEPQPSTVPNIVYTILWNGTYTFQNYLSLLSVVRHLRPYRIYMFVDGQPPDPSSTADGSRWYRRATTTVPNLEVISLHNQTAGGGTRVSGRHHKTRTEVTILRRFGGIYVQSDTIIDSSLYTVRQAQFHVGLTVGGVVSYIAAAPGVATEDDLSLAVDNMAGPTVSQCSAVGAHSGLDPVAGCLTFTQAVFRRPADIMYDTWSVAARCRSLMYGHNRPFRADRRLVPIPNIVHYVWLGGRDITYSMYLSFLSTVKYVRPRKVFIYVSKIPSDGYWSAISAHPYVTFVVYGPVTFIYGVRLRYLQHASDVIRADVLLRYGGIYVDWDILWIKPVQGLLDMGYETIVGPDRPPNTLNMGITLAQPGSRFLELWQASFQSYTGDHTTWHAVDVPYMIYEDHPAAVYIVRNLQLQCYKLRCNGGAEWRGVDALGPFYAVHLSQGSPVAFTSERILKMSNGMFANIGMQLLE